MVERRQAVLDTLRSADEPMTIVEIAGRLQVHPNTVRFHLQVLASQGRVERVVQRPSVQGRPPLKFRVLRAMDPSGTSNYKALADALATKMSLDPDPVDEAIRTGRSWGTRLAGEQAETAVEVPAVDRLLLILDDLGFSPELADPREGDRIELHHCPFLDLIPEHREVICPVHLGLMQGVMSAVGASVTVDRLEPFAEPDLCLAHLSTLVETS